MPEDSNKIGDPEIVAINTLMAVLSELNTEARSRVLGYVFGRLGVSQEALRPPDARVNSSVTSVLDIRSFATEKKPLTAIDRTALVAFYLSELAPEHERRRSIGQEEIVRYFKQAGFPLPSSPSMALVHARNAGFFELDGPGHYRLNAVGYNLVAHRMPKERNESPSTRRPKLNSPRAKVKRKLKALPAPQTEVASRTRSAKT